MNNLRRKTIESAKADIAEALSRLMDAKSVLESARDDEQEYRDNMPESLQDGEKAEKADAAIDALKEAIQGLDDIESVDFETLLETACE